VAFDHFAKTADAVVCEFVHEVKQEVETIMIYFLQVVLELQVPALS